MFWQYCVRGWWTWCLVGPRDTVGIGKEESSEFELYEGHGHGRRRKGKFRCMTKHTKQAFPPDQRKRKRLKRGVNITIMVACKGILVL